LIDRDFALAPGEGSKFSTRYESTLSDEEKYFLIELVKARPVLWEIGHRKYRNGKYEEYDEIAKEMNQRFGQNLTARIFQNEWRKLTIAFNTNRRKLESSINAGISEVGSRWRFFAPMDFLLDGYSLRILQECDGSSDMPLPLDSSQVSLGGELAGDESCRKLEIDENFDKSDSYESEKNQIQAEIGNLNYGQGEREGEAGGPDENGDYMAAIHVSSEKLEENQQNLMDEDENEEKETPEEKDEEDNNAMNNNISVPATFSIPVVKRNSGRSKLRRGNRSLWSSKLSMLKNDAVQQVTAVEVNSVASSPAKSDQSMASSRGAAKPMTNLQIRAVGGGKAASASSNSKLAMAAAAKKAAVARPYLMPSPPRLITTSAQEHINHHKQHNNRNHIQQLMMKQQKHLVSAMQQQKHLVSASSGGGEAATGDDSQFFKIANTEQVDESTLLGLTVTKLHRKLINTDSLEAAFEFEERIQQTIREAKQYLMHTAHDHRRTASVIDLGYNGATSGRGGRYLNHQEF